jgi:uncharacterized membrane protein YfcA
MDNWWLFFAIGFGAQLVDGTLGMAYGVLSNTALMAIGLPPAHASALVHTAEIFTTSASAASHIYHRNVDWRLVARLGIAGVLGAILGAWILSNVEVTSARRFVYAYLLIMGLYILWKSVRIAIEARKPSGWTALLGFVGGFLDASGGGGWGPMTTSTLVGSGHARRRGIRSLRSACSWRRAGRTFRGMARQESPRTEVDDRRRAPDRRCVRIPAFASVSGRIARFSSLTDRR